MAPRAIARAARGAAFQGSVAIDPRQCDGPRQVLSDSPMSMTTQSSEKLMNTQLYMVRENEDLPTRAMDGASVGDRALTGQVLNALYTLQEALDAAVLAGLIAVPQVKPAQGRFNELGSDAESHVLGVEIYRKLA